VFEQRITSLFMHYFTLFTVPVSACIHAGRGVLLVGVLGPSGPCEELTVRRVTHTQTYVVSYRPSVSGGHVIVVKWADQHIPGSPFHLLVH